MASRTKSPNTLPVQDTQPPQPPVPAVSKRRSPALKQAPKSAGTAPVIPAPKKAAPKRKQTSTKASALSAHDRDADLLALIAQSGLPDAGGKFAKLRADHARGKADVKTLLDRGQRDDFTRALSVWMKNMKYQIGLDPKDFNAETEVKWAKHLADIGAQLFATSMPMFISGGASSAETLPALVPFIPQADLVAFQIKLGTPTLLLVIFADGLTAEALHQRFDKFLELAKPLPQFGLRLNGSSTSTALICPLLVYFNEASFQTAVKELLPSARVLKVWQHLYLIAGFVSVANKQVVWPEVHGALASFGSWINKLTGTKAHPFETSDLAIVLSIADQM